jgi:hypothetical protein
MSNQSEKSTNMSKIIKTTDEAVDNDVDVNKNIYKNTENSKIEQEKIFAKKWDKTFNCDSNMDENNKQVFDVMKNKGMDAAVKHMFTERKTGRQLSYGEMRMLYG